MYALRILHASHASGEHSQVDAAIVYPVIDAHVKIMPMDTTGLTAQEYVDIQNLYAAYNLASDAGDAEAYAACFTDDGVLHITPLDVTVRGRASFIAFKQKDAAGRGGKYRRHWNGSLHLEKIDRDTVRGRCYFHGYNGTPGQPPTLADCGVYEDTITRVGGAWKYARRNLTLDASTWSAPTGVGAGARP